MTLDPITARRLADLALPGGPLFVIDVDDVVVEFLGPLRSLIEEEGLHLRLDTFGLHGNVVTSDGRRVDDARVSALIDQVFIEQERRQPIVDGALEGLARLNEHGEVVLLTAMRHGHFDVRERHLKSLGIDVPLVTTEGSKGKAIASLARTHPVAFVDDMPYNHHEVVRHVPEATTIHFMSDRSVERILPPLPDGTHRAADWDEVVRIALRDVAAASPAE